jgi:hypothetical protein
MAYDERPPHSLSMSAWTDKIWTGFTKQLGYTRDMEMDRLRQKCKGQAERCTYGQIFST